MKRRRPQYFNVNAHSVLYWIKKTENVAANQHAKFICESEYSHEWAQNKYDNVAILWMSSRLNICRSVLINLELVLR